MYVDHIPMAVVAVAVAVGLSSHVVDSGVFRWAVKACNTSIIVGERHDFFRHLSSPSHHCFSPSHLLGNPLEI